MLNATAAIAFIVIFALEAAVIIIGNVFTILVFKTHSGLHLKRTCLHLINLAVASRRGVPQNSENKITSLSPSWAFQTLGSCTSVMFLALISLERVYAVLWPLRHRVINTHAYIFSVALVWVTGLCIGGLCFLTGYHWKVDTVYVVATRDLLLFISLLVTCASYLSIRSRLYATKLALQVPHRRSSRDVLHSGRCVANLVVAWFRGVHNQRILLAVFFSDIAAVC